MCNIDLMWQMLGPGSNQALGRRGPQPVHVLERGKPQPEGAVAEGDVQERMHTEATPLSIFWESWDGGSDPAAAYAALDARLSE